MVLDNNASGWLLIWVRIESISYVTKKKKKRINFLLPTFVRSHSYYYKISLIS